MPVPGAEQRGALTRYAARLLEEAREQAADVVEAVLADAENEVVRDETPERGVLRRFAMVRRRALAKLRGLGKEQRAAAADGEEPAGTLAGQIEQLTPKQREAVWLRFEQGFRNAEIAGITGLSEHNVGFLLHTALTHLREARAADGVAEAVDDQRVTDSVLGELDEAGQGVFEDAMKADSATRKAVGVTRTLVRELETTLDAGGTARKRGGVTAARRGPGRGRRTWSWGLGLAACAAIGAGVWWWQRDARGEAKAGSAGAVADFSLKPDTWALPKGEGNGAGPRATAATARAKAVTVAPAAVAKARVEAREPEVQSGVGGGGGGTAGAGGASPAADVAGSGARSPRRGGDGASESARDAGAGKDGALPEPVTGGVGSASAVSPGAGDLGGAKVPGLPAGPAGPGARGPQASVAAPGGAAGKPTKASNEFSAAGGGDRVEKKGPAATQRAARAPEAERAAVQAVRTALAAKKLPSPADVEAGALQNYFSIEATVTAGEAEVGATTEVAEAPWAPEHRLVRVAVQAPADGVPRAQANLVLLVDVSASMEAPNRLPLVQDAARRLLAGLRPEDRVAVVTYAGEASIVLPATPVARASEIVAALGALRAAGQTNGGAGLRRAYETARAGFVAGGVNRVVLCTDGEFNMGVTSEAELTKWVATEAKAGVSLSVIGFGRGRQIDARLEALALQGGGRGGYANTRREAERRLAAEVDGPRATAARDVRVEFEVDPARVAACRLVGVENVFLSPEAASRQSCDAGDLVAGERRTALFELTPSAGRREWGTLSGLTLRVSRATDGTAEGVARSERRIVVADAGARFETASAEYKFSAAVAALGLALRESPVRKAKLAAVVRWTEEAAADRGVRDPGGYREEFLALAREVRAVAEAEGK